MDSRILPEGLYRIRSICRSKAGPGLLDISPSRWWAGVQRGEFPPPIKFNGMTFWPGSALLDLTSRMRAGNNQLPQDAARG